MEKTPKRGIVSKSKTHRYKNQKNIFVLCYPLQAVRLVADLCLDNSIHDPQLWNSVLQQLLAFGMVSDHTPPEVDME